MLTKPGAMTEIAPAGDRGQRLTAQMRACAGWATLEEHDKILDMACGDGALLNYLNVRYRLTVCGMCESADQARMIREQMDEADVISARMEDIPWRDGTFHAVFLPVALRGEEFRRVLGEVRRVLRDGGQFILAAPLRPFRGEECLSKRETMRLLQQSGFQDVSYRAGFLCGVIIGWKKPQKTGVEENFALSPAKAE